MTRHATGKAQQLLPAGSPAAPAGPAAAAPAVAPQKPLPRPASMPRCSPAQHVRTKACRMRESHSRVWSPACMPAGTVQGLKAAAGSKGCVPLPAWEDALWGQAATEHKPRCCIDAPGRVCAQPHKPVLSLWKGTSCRCRQSMSTNAHEAAWISCSADRWRATCSEPPRCKHCSAASQTLAEVPVNAGTGRG